MASKKHLLLFGAGKSATVLIDYLKVVSRENDWSLTVADRDPAMVQDKIGDHSRVIAREVDLTNSASRLALIETADLVISLLPPFLQFPVAKDCLALGKHFISASYTDPDIQLLANEIEQKGILFLCEMGLDPGIDHMSAMKIIDQIRDDGGRITSFRSHCGGLVSPESDNNPWHYKFSWNPRNVVVAGKAGAVFQENGTVVKRSYKEVFKSCGTVEIDALGALAFYPNRDSLSYMPIYGLEDTKTFIRTTLRYPDFCVGWNEVIAAGLTNEDNAIQTEGLTVAGFFAQHLSPDLANDAGGSLSSLFDFLGWKDATMINKGILSSADILQWILERKWALAEGDKDMIVMLHEIGFMDSEKKERSISSLLIVKGEDQLRTAMARTVGLPLGIAARLVLEGKITVTGLHIPTVPGIYEPVLAALEKEGIVFVERTF